MLKQEVIIIAYAFQQKIHNIMYERRSVDELGVRVEVTGASYSFVGEWQRANLVVYMNGAVFPLKYLP